MLPCPVSKKGGHVCCRSTPLPTVSIPLMFRLLVQLFLWAMRFILQIPLAETVDPTALGIPDEYPDTEWATEFPGFNPPSSVQIVPSVTNLAGSPNAAYKWVRINALT